MEITKDDNGKCIGFSIPDENNETPNLDAIILTILRLFQNHSNG